MDRLLRRLALLTDEIHGRDVDIQKAAVHVAYREDAKEVAVFGLRVAEGVCDIDGENHREEQYGDAEEEPAHEAHKSEKGRCVEAYRGHEITSKGSRQQRVQKCQSVKSTAQNGRAPTGRSKPRVGRVDSRVRAEGSMTAGSKAVQ